MEKHMLAQYINELDNCLFNVIRDNEKEFIDTFVRAEDDTRNYNLLEMTVNSNVLLYAVEISNDLRGHVVEDALYISAVIDWVCSKKGSDEPEDDPTSDAKYSAA